MDVAGVLLEQLAQFALEARSRRLVGAVALLDQRHAAIGLDAARREQRRYISSKRAATRPWSSLVVWCQRASDLILCVASQCAPGFWCPAGSNASTARRCGGEADVATGSALKRARPNGVGEVNGDGNVGTARTTASAAGKTSCDADAACTTASAAGAVDGEDVDRCWGDAGQACGRTEIGGSGRSEALGDAQGCQSFYQRVLLRSRRQAGARGFGHQRRGGTDAHPDVAWAAA